MAPSSSAKKVAKLASRGKGKKVRFQGGTIFPVAVGIVVVILLGLVVYARQSLPSEGSGPPRANVDHWHAAYGFYVCDEFLPKLVGTKEDTVIDSVTGQRVLANEKFRTTGVHSHGDGVIHYHPYSSRASGNRARLGIFLDVYDVELTDDKLVLPADQVGPGEQSVYDTGTFKCGDKKTKIVVRVWDHYEKVDSYRDRVTDFDNTRITNNGMVFTIAIVPDEADVNIPQPPWAPQLPALGAADGSGDTIPPADTTPGGGATTTTAGQGTSTTVAPSTSTAPTTSVTTTTSG